MSGEERKTMLMLAANEVVTLQRRLSVFISHNGIPLKMLEHHCSPAIESRFYLVNFSLPMLHFKPSLYYLVYIETDRRNTIIQ